MPQCHIWPSSWYNHSVISLATLERTLKKSADQTAHHLGLSISTTTALCVCCVFLRIHKVMFPTWPTTRASAVLSIWQDSSWENKIYDLECVVICCLLALQDSLEWLSLSYQTPDILRGITAVSIKFRSSKHRWAKPDRWRVMTSWIKGWPVSWREEGVGATAANGWYFGMMTSWVKFGSDKSKWRWNLSSKDVLFTLRELNMDRGQHLACMYTHSGVTVLLMSVAHLGLL